MIMLETAEERKAASENTGERKEASENAEERKAASFYSQQVRVSMASTWMDEEVHKLIEIWGMT